MTGTLHELGRRRLSGATADIAAGRMVVVVDGPDRENEGDLVLAADWATPEAVNFMAKHGRGLICVALEQERLAELEIPRMPTRGASRFETAFHISVDDRELTTTGISAHDRAATIGALASPWSGPDTFVRPGHVFPLAARPGGVLERPGHTEASLDLAALAGRAPAAVICEIVRDDGRMARLPELEVFARRHDLRLVSIEDLVSYRRHQVEQPLRGEESHWNLRGTSWRAIEFNIPSEPGSHTALVLGDPHGGAPVLYRAHSECLAGDVFGSSSCRCGELLELGLDRIAADGTGILIYTRPRPGARSEGADLDVTRARILAALGVKAVTAVLDLEGSELSPALPGIEVLATVPFSDPAPGPAQLRRRRLPAVAAIRRHRLLDPVPSDPAPEAWRGSGGTVSR